jgi:hypothetical protein
MIPFYVLIEKMRVDAKFAYRGKEVFSGHQKPSQVEF